MRVIKAPNALTHRQHQGFTLIELVSVIVLLGIIAATAVPKFTNLQSAARVAKITSLEGTIKSMRSQIKLACQVTPNCTSHARGQSVFMPALGQSVQLINQYSDAGEIERNDQIDDLISANGFTITSQNSNETTRWSEPNKTDCYVQYSQSGHQGNVIPLIEKVTTGC